MSVESEHQEEPCHSRKPKESSNELNHGTEMEDPLPEGWSVIIHENTLPFYFHQESGVVSWTRPYVRKYKTRDHTPPLSAFKTVLQTHEKDWKRLSEELLEQAKKRGFYSKSETVQIPDESEMKPAFTKESISTTESSKEISTSGKETINGSEKKTFQESNLLLIQFLTGEENLKITSANAIQSYLLVLVASLVALERRRKKRSYEEFLEENDVDRNEGKRIYHKKKITTISELNPNGKSPISFLQEYCNTILKTAPEYRILIQDDISKPYVTTVIINGIEYGTGAFTSKKQSKQLAAKVTLEKLCPGLYSKGNGKEEIFMSSSSQAAIVSSNEEENGSMRKLAPQILQEYALRYDIDVEYFSVEPETRQGKCEEKEKFQIVAKVNNRQYTGIGRNKKEAKQSAAYGILKQLYPDLAAQHSSFSSLEHSTNIFFKNEEEHNSSRKKGPNLRLLEQLKEEMRKSFPNSTTTTTTLSSMDTSLEGQTQAKLNIFYSKNTNSNSNHKYHWPQDNVFF